MRVLAVDPGPHVGVACYTAASGVENFSAWESTPSYFYTCIEGWIVASDVIVSEGFNISGRRASEANVTIEMIGVLRFLAARHGKTFVEQPPGAHRFAGSDKLKRLGWYTVGSDHARSATGHLVLYLAEANLIDRRRLLPGGGG